jgi:N-acetylmuramoyl-L-alanine amidase
MKPIKRKINKIIVHCTATPECREIDITDVRRWHVEERGWSDVGYHFLVLLDGTIQEGRSLERSGAHTKGHNRDSIGVAYVGGMSADGEQSVPKDTRTEEQKEALVDLLCELRLCYGGKIYGHRDFSSKACPSFDAKKEYENISNRY